MTPHANHRPAPVLISLPDGLSVSGVTFWAVRLAGVLAASGHAVTLAAHAEPAGQSCVALEAPAGVDVLSLRDLPPLRHAAGNLTPFIAAYRNEIRRLARQSGAPVVCIPTLLGDSFGIGAAIALAEPELIRIVGWQHADTPYDTRLLTYYEPVIASFVGVSRRVTQTIRAALPHRADSIAHLPNAVPVGHAPPERSPGRDRVLRLVYTGRIEHKQKRIAALVKMSDELARRRVPHTLSLIGDGPALEEMRGAIASPDRAARIALPGPLTGGDKLRRALREADCFVLASRYEGLSVAMLEAMAEGCVPIVTAVASGADEVVTDALSGLLVHVPADASDEAVGAAMADGVARFVASDRSSLAMEAWRRVRESFSLDAYAPRAGAVIDAAAAAPPRAWPASRPAAFTSGGASGGASGSVPADAAERLSRKLAELAGRSIVLHGAGRHTVELAIVLASSPARIVAITDDDPARWGQSLLGWPVLSPAEAHARGATDAVISSWLHADEILKRHEVYTRQKISVHHLYRIDQEASVDSYTSGACSN